MLHSIHPIIAEDTSHTVEILNLETMTWGEGPGLPEEYQWPDLHVMDGKLVLAAARPGEIRQILTLQGISWSEGGDVYLKVNNVSNSVAFTCNPKNNFAENSHESLY